MTQATDAGASPLAELLRAGQLPPLAERRRIRIQSGASLRRMGAELGVTATAVHHWENGVDNPSLENAVNYRRLLDQLAALIDGDGEVAS
jgi:DNA-binding XRE family transcriptional regulator